MIHLENAVPNQIGDNLEVCNEQDIRPYEVMKFIEIR